MRRTTLSLGQIIIFALLALGILTALVRNPMVYLIPIVIFGAIYYFYKNPPARRRGKQTVFMPKSSAREKKRSTTFRVIPGNKLDDDDKPRYH